MHFTLPPLGFSNLSKPDSCPVYNSTCCVLYIVSVLYTHSANSYSTESPGPPSSLRVSNVTNTSAVLSWSPAVNGGGRPLSEIVYTITAVGKYYNYYKE